ncbi:dTMP kinase [Roseovarius aestuarii]|nr:dTMP kinase [Roseovarius aestuarii]
MSEPSRTTGLFISFEGIDGSGKTTQANLLVEHLRSIGHNVTRTREPGGSPGGEQIRALVLEGDAGRWSPQTELLLFTAARRDHLERIIRPALANGEIVICDRFADSTRIYQGQRGADLRAAVEALHDLMIGQDPDLTLLIDMDPAIGLSRAHQRGTGEDRFESFGEELQRTNRAGFLALAKQFPKRIRVIDGTQDIDAVQDDIRAVVMAALT